MIELKFKELNQSVEWEKLPVIAEFADEQIEEAAEYVLRLFQCVEIRWAYKTSYQGHYVRGNVHTMSDKGSVVLEEVLNLLKEAKLYLEMWGNPCTEQSDGDYLIEWSTGEMEIVSPHRMTELANEIWMGNGEPDSFADFVKNGVVIGE